MIWDDSQGQDQTPDREGCGITRTAEADVNAFQHEEEDTTARNYRHYQTKRVAEVDAEVS